MLDDINGIGPKTKKILNDLGIYTKQDLITYYPYKYNLYKPTTTMSAKEQDTIVVTGKIESIPKVIFIRKKLNKLTFNLNDGFRIITVTLFNRAFIKNQLIINNLVTVIGKYNPKTNNFLASDIKITPILKETIEPVYHLNQNIKKSIFQKLIKQVLNEEIIIDNDIPKEISDKYNFISKQEAIKEIHNPTSNLKLKQARLLLIYEELLTFTTKINYLKINNKETKNCLIKQFDDQPVKKLINNLLYQLTQDQVKALEDIKNDFNSNKRMNRLILGDVGSGKTIVSFIALYMNYLSGYQGVLMAPTEILAKQHYNNIQNILLEPKISILTSSTTPKERAQIIEDLKNNKIDIIISTHSILNSEVDFNNLGLVITDEQHRFGVNQRKNLQNKGFFTDVLYMSATPIPRTLALTLFGDMDITEIKTKPLNRKQIITKLYNFQNIKEVLYEILNHIKAGHQVYVVAPLIESEEETNTITAFELEKKLNEAFNNKIPIGILHGKMKPQEKEKIMNNFKNNQIKILISTTIIEIGVDVSNATLMVIFNAEKYGLATLHQLRGRIGRNNLESKCILISDYDTPRLKVLEDSCDGFYIAEKDFELRGSGDIFGIKQSGDMNFKISDIKRDSKILKQCNEDSKILLKEYLNGKEIKFIYNIIKDINFLN